MTLARPGPLNSNVASTNEDKDDGAKTKKMMEDDGWHVVAKKQNCD